MTQAEITTEELPTTGRRYYPSTRERITRAMNDGVKRGHGRYCNPYKLCASGKPLWRAFRRGWWLVCGADPYPRDLPVVALSAEFADMMAEVEPELAGKLDRDSGGRAE